jgi:hypothetical protein
LLSKIAQIIGAAMGDYSSTLFARPSFSEGVGRLLDFGNTLSEYNRSQNGQEADLAALRTDALALGEDLRMALAGANCVQQITSSK